VLPWWEGADEAQSRCSSTAASLISFVMVAKVTFAIGKIICRDFSEPARADSDRCRHAGRRRNNHWHDGPSVTELAAAAADAAARKLGIGDSESQSPGAAVERRAHPGAAALGPGHWHPRRRTGCGPV
jgi:hypothetical protein